MVLHELSNTVFTFFGPPGSGKGTLTKKCEDMGFEVLSTGDLCRKHIDKGTEIGRQIEAWIARGQLIPDDLITEMVQGWLEEKLALNKPIILDGYPRTASQAEKFRKLYEKENYNFEFRVVLLEISDEEIIERLVNRRICSNRNCQAVFSLANFPPKEEGVCDYCESPLMRRGDDTEEVVKERLKHFPRYKQELIEYYASVGQPIEQLEVDNRSIEQVFEDFKQLS